MPQLCVAVSAFSRPEYLKVCLNSIKQGVDSDVPVFVFIDNDGSEGSEKCRQLATNFFKKKNVIHRKEHLGCARNLIDIRDTLFFNYKYNDVWIIEEDVKIGKYTYPFIMNLNNWAKRYSNIGAVSPWSICTDTVEEKKNNLNKVSITNTNWISYIMNSKCWDTIRKHYRPFEELQHRGNNRNHTKIREYISELVGNVDPVLGLIPPTAWDWNIKDKFKRGVQFPTGQDAMTVAAMYKEGFCKIAPLVNRCQYIGVNGLHGTEANFKQSKFDKVVLDEFQSDRYLSDFEFI